jgi:hypothetical protein
MFGNAFGFVALVIQEAPHIASIMAFTLTCASNKASSNNPDRSFVNRHKSHQLYQKQVSESSHF